MGMFMASLSFRCADKGKFEALRPELERIRKEIPGIVTNFDAEGPGYVYLSPYGDHGPVLGDWAEKISSLVGDYAVMAMCIDSDFDMMELYRNGSLVERSCIGECYYDLPEEMEVLSPDPENWKPLLLDVSQENLLKQVLSQGGIFAEDNLRALSRLTGLPIFDDELMMANV
jgi:hypothetical protein